MALEEAHVPLIYVVEKVTFKRSQVGAIEGKMERTGLFRQIRRYCYNLPVKRTISPSPSIMKHSWNSGWSRWVSRAGTRILGPIEQKMGKGDRLAEFKLGRNGALNPSLPQNREKSSLPGRNFT